MPKYTPSGKLLGRPPQPIEVRYWPKVEKRGPNECWPWQAGRDKDGYGIFRISGKTRRATHIGFFLEYGRWPKSDRFICHTCDHPWCQNPQHWFEGTHADNVTDSVKKQRHTKGSVQGLAKLTEQDIPVIREKYRAGMPSDRLAHEYHVGKSTMWAVVKKETWKHID